LRHWYVGVGVPVAETENVTLAPAVTVWLDGWDVMTGAAGAGLTVREAAELVAEPEALETTTV
jgi:hypothetical protein